MIFLWNNSDFSHSIFWIPIAFLNLMSLFKYTHYKKNAQLLWFKELNTLSKSSKVWKVTDIIGRSSVLVTAALWLLKCYLLYISHDLSWKQLPGEDRRGEQGTLFVMWASSIEGHHSCRHVQTSRHGTLTTLLLKSSCERFWFGIRSSTHLFWETQALSLKLFPFSFLIARQGSGVAQLIYSGIIFCLTLSFSNGEIMRWYPSVYIPEFIITTRNPL